MARSPARSTRRRVVRSIPGASMRSPAARSSARPPSRSASATAPPATSSIQRSTIPFPQRPPHHSPPDESQGEAMPTTSVNEIDISFELEGDGPATIVLINGLADNLQSWAFQMDDLLGAGYRILRFDNRGIGESSAPAGPYTSRMMADDAKALVDQIGITGFHQIGRAHV